MEVEECEYCESHRAVFQVGKDITVPYSVIVEANVRAEHPQKNPVIGAVEYFGETIRRRQCPRCR